MICLLFHSGLPHIISHRFTWFLSLYERQYAESDWQNFFPQQIRSQNCSLAVYDQSRPTRTKKLKYCAWVGVVYSLSRRKYGSTRCIKPGSDSAPTYVKILWVWVEIVKWEKRNVVVERMHSLNSHIMKALRCLTIALSPSLQERWYTIGPTHSLPSDVVLSQGAILLVFGEVHYPSVLRACCIERVGIEQ